MSDERGTVLLEALVAIAILAEISVLAFRASGESAVRTQRAEIQRLAVLVAQSRLASVGSELPLRDGSFSGVDGDFEWTVTERPIAAVPSRAGRLVAVSIDVSGRASGRGSVAPLAHIDTLRLAPA